MVEGNNKGQPLLQKPSNVAHKPEKSAKRRGTGEKPRCLPLCSSYTGAFTLLLSHFAGVVNGIACYGLRALLSGCSLSACVRIAQVTLFCFFLSSH